MKKLLESLVEKNKVYAKEGKLASYIPALMEADPEALGVCVVDLKDNYEFWADENSDLLDIKSWHKSDKPVFKTSEENKQYGPGHNCFTTDNGKDVLIYHSRNYKEIKGDPLHDNNRHARAKVFEYDENGLPIFGEPVPKNI